MDQPRKRFQFSLAALIVAVLLAGVYVALLIERQVNDPKRQVQRTKRTASANNLKQLGTGLSLYESGEHRFPDDPTLLFSPALCCDLRMFVNPRFPKQDVGYIYISGSTVADSFNLVMYENVPDDQSVDGRNILLANGSVEWISEDMLEASIKRTEEAIRTAGRVPVRVPISRAALEKNGR